MDFISDENPEYGLSLRIVRIEIGEDVFENIITNLPDTEFSTEDFKDLYHLRWQVENAFRDTKYPLCLNDFHSKKYEYIVNEVWARAILYNFCSAIIMNVRIEKTNTKYSYKVNFAEGLKTCRDFLRIRGPAAIQNVEDLIARNIEAIRPGRTFARQHRFQLPFSLCYRN